MSPKTTRTDRHRSTEIVPADYTWVGVFYQGGSDDETVAYRFDNHRRTEFIRSAADRGQRVFVGNHDTKGTCDICGTAFAHGAYWLHSESGDIIHTGQQCAEKLDMAGSSDMAKRRGAIAATVTAAKKQAERDAARQAFLAQHDGLAEALALNIPFIKTLADNLQRWGNLSPRQIEVALRIHGEELAKANAPTPEPTEATPIETGKAVTVTGTVKSVKVKYNDYGERLVMTVEDDRGWRVWGSVPASLCGPDGLSEGDWGQRVTFTAAVEQADAEDDQFGFFKRPRKAQLITEALEVAA